VSNKLERLDPKLLVSNPRATLKAWRKYESIVIAAFRSHPKTYIFKPSALSPATVCTRVREAVRGKLCFDYESEVSTQDLLRWFSETVFKYDSTNVYIGPLSDVQETISGESPSTGPKVPFSFTTLSFEEITAFTLLLSTGKLIGPVAIKSPPDMTLLPLRQNVQILSRPDGSIILL
jgi:hypothetical protein